MSDGQGNLYGSRELETQGACSELNDSLVFVVAVTLRPEAAGVVGSICADDFAATVGGVIRATAEKL